MIKQGQSTMRLRIVANKICGHSEIYASCTVGPLNTFPECYKQQIFDIVGHYIPRPISGCPTACLAILVFFRTLCGLELRRRAQRTLRRIELITSSDL
jgi:hypothetical protein